MSRTPIQNQNYNTLLSAINGDPGSLDELYYPVYAYHQEETPGSMNSENTWEVLNTVPEGPLQPGRYSLDFQVSWTVAASQSRLSGVRLDINGVKSSDFTRQTVDATDIASVSGFFDFVVTERTDITIALEGFLSIGGGAALLQVENFSLRIARVDGETGEEASNIRISP